MSDRVPSDKPGLTVDDLFVERVLQARKAPLETKLLEGARLFNRVCEVMRAGIRWQYPQADDNEVTRILRHRLEIARLLEVRP